jgi:hypothetical protein
MQHRPPDPLNEFGPIKNGNLLYKLGTTPKYIEVYPVNVVSSASVFRFPVGIVQEKELTRFIRVIGEFFKSFQAINFKDLSLPHIQNLLVHHSLDTDNLMSEDKFVKNPRNGPRGRAS